MLILKVCPLHVTGTSACRRIFGEGGCQDMIEDLRKDAFYRDVRRDSNYGKNLRVVDSSLGYF